MKSPCIGACKSNGDMCTGCQRTTKEIAEWQSYSDAQRNVIMNELRGEASSHQCPKCNAQTQCDVQNGKETCWCFYIEKRDSADVKEYGVCLCRKCLSSLPIL
ncbi:cysteine-rich CWC family protein [Vibrio kyushuensis]|uniref:cysteine-rich CWC family protein n=1 Tax=Vibrio kyushuensis TaxID=2910249 RepID=UPI003D144707